ncbi:hypothetical protein [Cohnella luojiensis]|uniref:DUF3679 domain-containing protein n=1 Tax=Cohnella luojiensis TaxID=652876 RepID=A0A4Y8M7T8_9BACL|nr:hypothetical protein [Cohnella luojiensis]TFE31644.1 hypothetical protein E2980_00765 [Cohnella luojiensis]
MRRDTFKLLVFAAILGFAVLYGMELSSKGIENVNGSLVSDTNGQAVEEGDWTLPANQTPRDSQSPDQEASAQGRREAEDNLKDWDEAELGIPRNDREPIVDRVSGKTADVLHDLSRNGIRMVVSIFDKVMG